MWVSEHLAIGSQRRASSQQGVAWWRPAGELRAQHRCVQVEPGTAGLEGMIQAGTCHRGEAAALGKPVPCDVFFLTHS